MWKCLRDFRLFESESLEIDEGILVKTEFLFRISSWNLFFVENRDYIVSKAFQVIFGNLKLRSFT